MRFLSMVKSAENDGPPPPELLDAMAKVAEQEASAGILVAMGGLLPSAAGARVRLAAGTISASDGPFAEAKEVVGGYAFLEVASKEEAVAAAERLLELHRQHWPGWEGEVEIRPVAEVPDFPPA